MSVEKTQKMLRNFCPIDQFRVKHSLPSEQLIASLALFLKILEGDFLVFFIWCSQAATSNKTIWG